MDESPSGTKDDWSEATSRAVIPVAALERFWTEHPEVSARGSRQVELALWQWVRIEGRSPGTHALPSRAVEAMWRALRRDEADWEAFRDSLGIELDSGLDGSTRWVPDAGSESMSATRSDAFADELPFAGDPMLFTVDSVAGFAEPASDPTEPDPAPTPDAYDVYEPAESGPAPVRGPPARDTSAWDRLSGIAAAVAELAPAGPSVRGDGLRAVLRERRERGSRSLLDGWAVLAANTSMPPGLDARLAEQFPEVGAEGVDLVWDAFLQWLRIEGRNYPTAHAMPARSVEALLSMLRSDPSAWNQLREAWPVNLDHLFADPPGPWMPGDALEPLRATWRDTFNEEPPKSRTPLLFRVDAEVGITGARTYQTVCKQTVCAPPTPVICLHYLG